MKRRNAVRELSPGVKEPLFGWAWVAAHEHDRVPVQFELFGPHGHYTVEVNDDQALREVVKTITG